MVSREEVPIGDGPYQWLGANIAGDTLPDGTYSLSLENYQGEEQIGSPTSVESYAQIMEARGGANGPTLVLRGGIEVAATKVTALRVP